MKKDTINLCSPLIGKLEHKAVRACLDSGFVSSAGPLIAAFEQKFARRIGAKYAVATASGTAALHTAMRVLGIGTKKNQSVVVPDLTFAASVNPVLYSNAIPLLADIHPETWTLDPAILEALCRRPPRDQNGGLCRPAAVVPVHLYGCACDMPAILRIARQYNLPVIEDATEALGTTIRNRHAGIWGDIGCFSFNGNKMITTGGGGMLVTNSKKLADRARHLVNQARISATEYLHDTVGYNYRMTNLTAALGMAQMQRLDRILHSKRRIARRYRQALATYPDIKIMPEPDGVHNCFWLYSIVFPNKAARQRAATRLAKAGIPTRNFFVPLHRQPYLKKYPLWTMRDKRLTPVSRGYADDIAERGLNLPSSPEMTATTQVRIITELAKKYSI